MHLSLKKGSSDSRAFVWCVNRSYTIYTFLVKLDGKRRKKKEEEEEHRPMLLEVYHTS